MELLSNGECLQVLRKFLGDPEAEMETFSLEDFPINLRGFLSIPATLRVKTCERELSFFVKYVPLSNPLQGDIVKALRVFYKESTLYEGILEELRCYIEGSIYPQCYFTRSDDIIVLEHMIEQGFMTTPSNIILDEDHCLVGLQALAKLHAASIIYEERNKVQICEKYNHALFETIYLNNPKNPNCMFLKVGISSIMCAIKKYFPQTSPWIKERIHESLLQQLTGLPSSTRIRNVFTHGDMWANNILFHYTNNSVDDIRLIDFQLSRYSSPTFDVAFFLYLSTMGVFRKEKLNDLLKFYYKNLKVILFRHNLKVEEILPWKLVKNEVDHEKVLVLCCTIIHLHYVLIPQHEVRKFMDKPEEYEKIVKVSRDHLVLQVMENDKKYRDRILDILTDLVDAVEYKYRDV